MAYANARAWQAVGRGLRNIGGLLTEQDEEQRLREEERAAEVERLLGMGGEFGDAPTIPGPGAMAPIAEQDPMQTPSAIPGVRMPSTLPPQYEMGTQPDPRYVESTFQGEKTFFKHPAVQEQEKRDQEEILAQQERDRVAHAAAAEEARMAGLYETAGRTPAISALLAAGGTAPAAQPYKPMTREEQIAFAADRATATRGATTRAPTVEQAYNIVKDKYAIYEGIDPRFPSSFGLSDEQMYSMAQEMAAGGRMPLDPRPHGPPMSLDPTGGEPRLGGIGRMATPVAEPTNVQLAAPPDTLRLGGQPTDIDSRAQAIFRAHPDWTEEQIAAELRRQGTGGS